MVSLSGRRFFSMVSAVCQPLSIGDRSSSLALDGFLVRQEILLNGLSLLQYGFVELFFKLDRSKEVIFLANSYSVFSCFKALASGGQFFSTVSVGLSFTRSNALTE